MSKPKLTRWFPGAVEPSRPGVYQRQIDGSYFMYGRWTGVAWMFSEKTADAAAKTGLYSVLYSLPWRGLAQDPKATQ